MKLLFSRDEGQLRLMDAAEYVLHLSPCFFLVFDPKPVIQAASKTYCP
jgi:hypothetical protein